MKKQEIIRNTPLFELFQTYAPKTEVFLTLHGANEVIYSDNGVRVATLKKEDGDLLFTISSAASVSTTRELTKHFNAFSEALTAVSDQNEIPWFLMCALHAICEVVPKAEHLSFVGGTSRALVFFDQVSKNEKNVNLSMRAAQVSAPAIVTLDYGTYHGVPKISVIATHGSRVFGSFVVTGTSAVLSFPQHISSSADAKCLDHVALFFMDLRRTFDTWVADTSVKGT